MNPARFRAYTQLLIVVVIWGIAGAVIKFALGELPPFLFLTYRFFITTIVMLPFYIKSKEKRLGFNNLLLVIITSFLGSTLSLGLLFYGTNLTTSLDSSLISATAPIFIIIASSWFLKEHITHKEKIGIAVTMLGTLIITLQSFLGDTAVSEFNTFGNFIVFLSNITFVGYILLSKKALRRGVSPITITFMMFFVGFLTTLPLALGEVGVAGIITKITSLTFSAHLSVFYMAILSGAVAYMLYQKAQKTIEASEASIFNYLPPIITAPVAMLWLHEKITYPYIIGSIIIAVGVILAEWKKRKN